MSRRYVGDGKGEMLGSDLPVRLQDEAKRQYVHRYTGEHCPQWAAKGHNGRRCPLQFRDDADWLAHTTFAIVGLKLASADCYSRPTWPNGR